MTALRFEQALVLRHGYTRLSSADDGENVCHSKYDDELPFRVIEEQRQKYHPGSQDKRRSQAGSSEAQTGISP